VNATPPSGAPRVLRPTGRGAVGLLAWAGAVVVAIVGPSSAGTGLCAALTVALGLAVASVLIATRRTAGNLQSVLEGHTLVARGHDAFIALRLAGVAPALGCRLCLDRSSVRWARGTRRPSTEDRTTRAPRLAPPADGRLRVAGSLSGAPSARIVVPTRHRGVYVCRGVALWMYDPLGLFGVRLAGFPDLVVVVHPVPVRSDRIPASPTPHGSLHDGVALANPTMSPARSGGADAVGVRPYRAGDRWSSVHWRGLGSTWPLLVWDLGDSGTGTPHLVLDDRAGVHRRVSFEAALDLVVGHVATRPSSAPPMVLRSLASADAVLVAGGSPSESLLRWLAAIEPRRTSTVGPRATRSSGGAGPGDVVVTTVTGARSLGELERRGVRLVVAE